MQVTLYNYACEHERVRKGSYMTAVDTLDVQVKTPCDVANPTFILTTKRFYSFNYIYSDVYKRYYFVNSITLIENGLYEIECHVDVLMSFYNEYKNVECQIVRSATHTNQYLTDGCLSQWEKPRLQVKAFPNEWHSSSSIVISVLSK